MTMGVKALKTQFLDCKSLSCFIYPEILNNCFYDMHLQPLVITNKWRNPMAVQNTHEIIVYYLI